MIDAERLGDTIDYVQSEREVDMYMITIFTSRLDFFFPIQPRNAIVRRSGQKFED
jgi:hypothetical protein